MNQIAAALLILSASICGTAAVYRPTTAPGGFGGMLGLVALGLGLWGGMALLTTVAREREHFLEETPRLPLGATAISGLRSTLARGSDYATSTARDVRLSPELNAQVALAAEMKGQTRTDIVEETLRRHLPRYGGTRVAS